MKKPRRVRAGPSSGSAALYVGASERDNYRHAVRVTVRERCHTLLRARYSVLELNDFGFAALINQAPFDAVEQCDEAERIQQIVVRRKFTGLRRQIFSGHHKRFDTRSFRLIGDRAPASIAQVDLADGEIERLRVEERAGARHAI